MSAVQKQADDQSNRFRQRESDPDSGTPPKQRKEKHKSCDENAAPQQTEKKSFCRGSHRLKVADKCHVQSQKQETCEVDSDSGCGKSQDFLTWIQKDISKKIGYGKPQKYRDTTDGKRSPKREGLNFPDPFL